MASPSQCLHPPRKERENFSSTSTATCPRRSWLGYVYPTNVRLAGGGSALEMWQGLAFQGRADQLGRILVSDARRGRERHAAAPVFRGLGMDAAKHDPTAPDRSLNNRRCAIGV